MTAVCSRLMAHLQVIGAGFGRTGTTSLCSALDTLGLGPCYHMRDVIAQLDATYAAAADLAGWDRVALELPDGHKAKALRMAGLTLSRPSRVGGFDRGEPG